MYLQREEPPSSSTHSSPLIANARFGLCCNLHAVAYFLAICTQWHRREKKVFMYVSRWYEIVGRRNMIIFLCRFSKAETEYQYWDGKFTGGFLASSYRAGEKNWSKTSLFASPECSWYQFSVSLQNISTKAPLVGPPQLTVHT